MIYLLLFIFYEGKYRNRVLISWIMIVDIGYSHQMKKGIRWQNKVGNILIRKLEYMLLKSSKLRSDKIENGLRSRILRTFIVSYIIKNK